MESPTKKKKEKATKTPLVRNLEAATSESIVESAYRAEFRAQFPEASLVDGYGSDGFLKAQTLHVLMEFKYALDFNKATDRAKPIIQSLMYLKKYREHEPEFPSSVFIGDEDGCFIVDSDVLAGYLDRSDIDWTVAPSSAWEKCPELFRELIADTNINPNVLDVKARRFYFKDVVKTLEALHEGSVHKVPITVSNIAGIYRSWADRVLKEKLTPQDSVGVFIMSVLDKTHLHSGKKDTLLWGTREVSVREQQHAAFFTWFKQDYRVTKRRNFTAIKDRLIDEEDRRRSGDFYTPTVWSNEAHKMLDAELGPDWRDEYVVWDCAAGTANLTRDYTFKELYLSTLFEDDVSTVQAMGYNKGSDVFQFDFLNDPIAGDDVVPAMVVEQTKIPAGLQRALDTGKKMVFFINPPFGTASASTAQGANMEGVANTGVRENMQLGKAQRQLYAQFMYRITELVRVFRVDDPVFAFYSTPLFFTGPIFKEFRKHFYKEWEFQQGMLFRADEFNGTSSEWGCSFTVWRGGIETRRRFDLQRKQRDKHGIVVPVQMKAFYLPTLTASKWVKAPNKLWFRQGLKEYPKFTSTVKFRDSEYNAYLTGGIGYFLNKGNNVAENGSGIVLFSSVGAAAGGVHIFPCNWRRCISLFTARKTIQSTWINQKDEYCKPDTTHPDYAQWVNDAHIYSLFQSSSQQSSLRQIDFDDKKWDIENEFFWLSRQEMRSLADVASFDAMYNDCGHHGGADRYMYTQLQQLTLSPDAQDVLDTASDLVRKAMSMREQAYQERPDLHLDAFDAGWYQIRKGMLEPYFNAEYKAFVVKYKKLEDRLRQGVYTFGFLK